MSQHNTLTLEPCPFCGAQPEQCDVGDHVVTCPSCGVDGPYGAPSGVAGAIQGWNRRAALSATQPAQAAQGAGEAVASIYITPDGSREMDDWKHDLPVGQNILYTQPAAGADVLDAKRYRWLRAQDNEDFAFAVVKNPHFDVYGEPEELDTAIDAAIAASGRKS